jgi:hypothetical protein
MTLSNKYTNIFESCSNIEADRALFLWWSVVECGGGSWIVVECGGVWWSGVECGGVWWRELDCGGVWWSVVE